mgnify:CR=1 FL=1
MSIQQQKEKFRSKLLEQRESISATEYFGASAAIIERLKDQPEFQSAKTVHSYVSMNKRREVETQELIIEMLSKGKQIVVPVTNIDEHTLNHVHLTSFKDLETNKWGVLEPKSGTEISPSALDLVIIPMVAADEYCNRMGYGKGFYDRFLKQVHAPKIGLIFEQNVVDELPTEEFDIPMDKIITEIRTIHHQ